jgi:peptidoglycan biosynthesis protein MviN/MurJ (putative lipid II flippase)
MVTKLLPKASSSSFTGEEVSDLKLKNDTHAELSVGKLIGVVVLVIIGLLLLPIVQDSVYTASENENTTATQETLLDMITIFYVLGICLAAVMWVVHESGFGKG